MLASMQQANNAMMAATHGVKMETLSVADFLPRDSMPWIKRTKLNRGITHPKAQTDIIKRAFGFR